ncbi:hypothetical protein AB0P21_21270 [Kribbella sp. NPDC056861]|uniref:hypothetical protein n=1 Tax=Kribbella sp. NPDC056861 TaxID=3154857 RepID=UPI00342998CC
MPRTLINQALIAVITVLSALLIVDAMIDVNTRNLVIGLLLLTVAAISAPGLRRAEQRRTKN